MALCNEDEKVSIRTSVSFISEQIRRCQGCLGEVSSVWEQCGL